jgi:phage gp36-like protein
MASTYIVAQVDIEDRLGPATVKQIYDDNNDGTPDVRAIARLIADSQARVMGYARRSYDPAQITLLLATPPDLLICLVLDVAQSLAFERYPTYCRFDGEKLLARVNKDLENLAKGILRVDGVQGNPADPVPLNVSGTVESGDPLNPAVPRKQWSDGMGDF